MYDDIINEIVRQALSKLDVNLIIDEMMPKIKENVETGIIEAIENIDFRDFICDAFNSEDFQKVLAKKLISGLAGNDRKTSKRKK